MAKQEVLLDTRGHCFLCLKSPEHQSILEKRTLLYFLDPNHYLNLKLGADVKDSSDWNSSDVKGSLCEDCGKISERISKLFLQFLEVQLKLRISLVETLEKINEGDKAREIGFRNEILKGGREMGDLVQKLRRETMERCQEVSRKQRQPRVRLEKIRKADVLENIDEVSNGPVIVSTSTILPGNGAIKKKRSKTLVPRTCRVCSGIFYGQLDLKKHIKKAHDGRGFPCEDCGGRYKNSKYLCNHRRVCIGILYNRKFDCLICGKVFGNTRDFSNHRKEKHQGMKIKCDWCLELFPSKYVMQVHQEKSCPGNPNIIIPAEPQPVPEEEDSWMTGEDCKYVIGSGIEVNNGLGVEMKYFGNEVTEESCEGEQIVTGI